MNRRRRCSSDDDQSSISCDDNSSRLTDLRYRHSSIFSSHTDSRISLHRSLSIEPSNPPQTLSKQTFNEPLQAFLFTEQQQRKLEPEAAAAFISGGMNIKWDQHDLTQANQHHNDPNIYSQSHNEIPNQMYDNYIPQREHLTTANGYGHPNESLSIHHDMNSTIPIRSDAVRYLYQNPMDDARLVEEFEMRYQPSRKSQETIDLNTFELIMTLGQGSFGRVLLVVLEPEKIQYALKVLDKAKIIKYKQIEHVRNEIRILHAIQHPNIVIMHSFFKDNSYLYVLMEYVRGGDLFGYMRKSKAFEESIAQFFAAQIVLVFEYLHFFNIVYRDLKPENILIDDHGYLKVLIYELNTGNAPFKGQSEVLLFEAICRKKPPIRAAFSSTLKDIILQLLQKDPSVRLGSSAKGAIDVKEHPWFSRVNFASIYNQQIPSPFRKQVVIRSLSEYRRKAQTQNEKPLLISDRDDYADSFKDF